MTPSQVGPLIEDLERQRYKYEDFWLLISQEQSQVNGFEDSGNAWAKKKLARLDFEEKQERDHHWSHRKLKVIKQEIGQSFPVDTTSMLILSSNLQEREHPACSPESCRELGAE